MAESERILLERCARSGDAEAFSEIVRRHAGLVYGACMRVLSDKDRSAEVVQETFLALLRNMHGITGSIAGWLHRVATNKAIDVVRRDCSRRRREAEYAANKPVQAENWEDISPHIDEALNELDADTREILIARFFEGHTMTDVAESRGISHPTVSRRIEAGVTSLRMTLQKRGIIVAAVSLMGLLGENAAEAAPAAVLKELGKLALAGPAAAGATSVAGVGASKMAAGAAAMSAKAKIVTAAAVAAVGIGSVATYHHVTQSP